MYSAAISKASAAMESEAAPKMPGIAVAVAINGTLIWQQAYGFANLPAKVPVTVSTRFRIASVSKPFTAAGLALLVERGLLDLDAPVQRYLPDFPQKSGVLTTRLLAGHLTGIRNYRGTEVLGAKPYSSLRAGLKIFEDDPLESEPGTRFSYSSYNWNVIGTIMEAVTQQDFPGYMADHVFKPLEMTNTVADWPDAHDPQRAQFYEVRPTGEFVPAPPADYSYKWPSGGFLSTVEDMAKFGSAHLRPGFLRAESVKLLFTSQRTMDGNPTGNSVGWFIQGQAVFHTGDNLGGTSVLLMLPKARLVVALASNGGQVVLRNAIRQGRVGQEVAQRVFNQATTAGKIARIFADSLKK